MKLFLRRNVSADNNIFSVFDEQGFEKYNIVSKKANSNSDFAIQNTDGQAVCRIRRLPVAGTNIYLFKADKKRIAFIRTLIADGIKCHYYGNNWHVIGNISAKNFSVVDVDNSLIATHKKVMSDYELNIFDSKNEMFCIATSLCIDLINTIDNRAAQAI